MTQEKTCKACIHEPREKEEYTEECGTCSRWYADKYEGEPMIIGNKLKEIRALQDRISKLIADIEKLAKNND